MDSRKVLNTEEAFVMLCYEFDMMGGGSYRDFLSCLEIPSLGMRGYYLLNMEATNKISGVFSILEEYEAKGYNPKAEDIINMLSVLVADMNGLLMEEVSLNEIVGYVVRKYGGVYSDGTFKKCEVDFNNKFLNKYIEESRNSLVKGVAEYSMSQSLASFCRVLLENFIGNNYLCYIKVSLVDKRIVCYCKDKLGSLFEGIDFKYNENSVVDWNGNFLENLVGCVNSFDREFSGLCKTVLISYKQGSLKDFFLSEKYKGTLRNSIFPGMRYKGTLCDGLFLIDL